jgi:hypothetical protein
MDDQTRRRFLDEEHLRLLRIGYLISAGVTAFFSLFGLLYAMMGFLFMAAGDLGAPVGAKQMPPPQFGWFFVVFGLLFTTFAFGVAALKLGVARCLAMRRAWTFCMVVGAISCLGVPYGTVLGVFTFAVLQRDPVRELFRGQPSAVAPPGAPDGV